MAQLSDFTRGQKFVLSNGKINNYGKKRVNFKQDALTGIEKVLKEHGDLALNEMKANLDHSKSNASFNLRQSINPVGVVKRGDQVFYQFKIAGYYMYVDMGRGARKTTKMGNPPLKEAIRQWLDERAIGNVKDRKRMAYFIARKINRSGLKGNKFFSSVFDEEFKENLSRELSIELKTIVIQQILEK